MTESAEELSEGGDGGDCNCSHLHRLYGVCVCVSSFQSTSQLLQGKAKLKMSDAQGRMAGKTYV